jgi:hypothetical protein
MPLLSHIYFATLPYSSRYYIYQTTREILKITLVTDSTT